MCLMLLFSPSKKLLSSFVLFFDRRLVHRDRMLSFFLLAPLLLPSLFGSGRFIAAVAPVMGVVAAAFVVSRPAASI